MTVSITATVTEDYLRLKGTGESLQEACRDLISKVYAFADIHFFYPNPDPFCKPAGAGYIYLTDRFASKAALREQDGMVEYMMAWTSGETLHTYVHTEPLEPTVENTLAYIEYALGNCKEFSISFYTESGQGGN